MSKKKKYDDDLFSNDDVATEIMSRIPLKPLLQFRSINKSWCRMIDSPQLRKLHIENQLSMKSNAEENDSVLLQFSEGCQELSIMHLDTGKCHFGIYQDFFKNNHVSQLCGPVHGLICLHKEYSTEPIALCNPSLGEIKIVPPSSSSMIRLSIGLGYDDLKKDFKIVQMSHHKHDLVKLVFEIYSRKEKSWRVVLPHIHVVDDDYSFLKAIKTIEPLSRLGQLTDVGVVHWVVLMEGGGRAILSLDVHSEELEIINIPYHHTVPYWRIFAKEDSSFVMFAKKFDFTTCVWEYKRELREWIKVSTLIDGLYSQLDPIATTWNINALVLKIYPQTVALLDMISSVKLIKSFKFPGPRDHYYLLSVNHMVEYRGSFISP